MPRRAPLELRVGRESNRFQRGRIQLGRRVLEQFPVRGGRVDEFRVGRRERGARVGRGGKGVHEDEADVRPGRGPCVLDLRVGGGVREVRAARARSPRQPTHANHLPNTPHSPALPIDLLRDEVQERFAALDRQQRFRFFQPHGRAQAAVELEHGRLGEQSLRKRGGRRGFGGRRGRQESDDRPLPTFSPPPDLELRRRQRRLLQVGQVGQGLDGLDVGLADLHHGWEEGRGERSRRGEARRARRRARRRRRPQPPTSLSPLTRPVSPRARASKLCRNASIAASDSPLARILASTGANEGAMIAGDAAGEGGGRARRRCACAPACGHRPPHTASLMAQWNQPPAGGGWAPPPPQQAGASGGWGPPDPAGAPPPSAPGGGWGPPPPAQSWGAPTGQYGGGGYGQVREGEGKGASTIARAPRRRPPSLPSLLPMRSTTPPPPSSTRPPPPPRPPWAPRSAATRLSRA